MHALTLLAQAGIAGAIGYYVIIIIVVVAIVAIGLVAARAAGVEVPGWFVKICWIVLAAAVAVVAIKLVLSLL